MKVGIEYIVEADETPEQALEQARSFVDKAVAYDQRRGKADALAAKARTATSAAAG